MKDFEGYSKVLELSSIIDMKGKKVVITQRPIKSGVNMDEKLISGDLLIIEYRKYRQKLINGNNYK